MELRARVREVEGSGQLGPVQKTGMEGQRF